MKIVLNK